MPNFYQYIAEPFFDFIKKMKLNKRGEMFTSKATEIN